MLWQINTYLLTYLLTKQHLNKINQFLLKNVDLCVLATQAFSNSTFFGAFSFKPIPFSVVFFFRNVHSFITHSSENGWDRRSPKPSTAKSGRFSRLLRDLRFVSKLAVLPQDSQIFRIDILLNFKILFLEAYHFQNSEGLDGLKEYALNSRSCLLTEISQVINVGFLSIPETTRFSSSAEKVIRSHFLILKSDPALARIILLKT